MQSNWRKAQLFLPLFPDDSHLRTREKTLARGLLARSKHALQRLNQNDPISPTGGRSLLLPEVCMNPRGGTH